MPEAETRRLRDLKLTFFVRTGLDPKRLEYFRQLRAASVPFPPLLITTANEVLDGRHRLAIATERREPSVPVTVVQAEGAEQILLAAKANLGGPQPLTMPDLVHTADLLLASGLTQKDAAQQLATLLPERFVSHVLESLRRLRRRQAVFTALRDLKAHPDQTLKATAEKHGVTPGDLQNRLEQSAGKEAIPTRTAEFVKLEKHLSLRWAAFLQKLCEDFSAGLTDARSVDAALDVYETNLRSLTATYRQWVKRWAEVRSLRKKKGVA